MNSWRLVILPGKHPPQAMTREWEETYRSWKCVWSAAYAEAKLSKPMHSDEFTRQDDVMALFEGDRCLMSLFFRDVNLTHVAPREDSYFAAWPASCIEALQKYSSWVSVGCQTTVIPEVRGNYQGYSMKRLLLALLAQYAMHSRCSSVTAAMRNLKGMQTAGTEAGARLLEADVICNGEATDLMAFFGSELRDFRHQYQVEAETLWNARWDHREFFNRDRSVTAQRAA